MPFCPICSLTVQNLQSHVLSSPCSSKIIGEYATSIKFQSGSICRHCDKFFEKKEYQSHAKSRARSIRSQSKASSIQSLDQTLKFDQVKKKRKMEQTTENLVTSTPSTLIPLILTPKSQYQELKTALLQLSKVKLTYFIGKWLQSHNSINQAVLYRIYDNYINRLTSSLSQIIPEVKISDLYSLARKIKWDKIVNKPQELFDSRMLMNRIQKLTSNLKEQNKILSVLNTFFQKFPGTFTQFQLQKIVKQLPQNPRNKQPLMPETLFQVVKWLFSSKIRQLVHFGIDLLLIFQSGLRFPSSFDQVNTKFVAELKKTKGKAIEYQTMQTKTYKKINVIIDSQLIHLMKISDWKGLAFKKQIYERMTKFLQFTLYSLRRGYLSFVILQNSKTDLHFARHLSQHTSAANLSFYVQSVIKGQLKKIKQNLRMSGIIGFPAKEYEAQKDINFQHFQLSQNWKQRCWNFLINLINQQDLVEVLQNNNQQFVIPKKLQISEVQKIDQNKQNQEKIDSDQESQMQKTKVIIRHLQFQLTNGLFSLPSFYTKSSQPCSKKDQQHKQDRFKCNQCLKVYCQLCQIQPFCPCFQINLTQKQTFLPETSPCKISISMPEKYISNDCQYFEDFLQIRFLIHARGFYFTNVCVEHEEVIHNISSTNIPNEGELFLKNFKQYVKGNYFPPVKIRLFGQNNSQGCGFGLFATQEIQQNIFIGQYAANKLPIRLQRFVSRRDMIFKLGDVEKDDLVIIGPRDYCGYVPLINEDKRNMNCKFLTVIIEGKVRIIVYTLKKINAGQQLFVDYQRQKLKTDLMDQQIQHKIQQMNKQNVELQKIADQGQILQNQQSQQIILPQTMKPVIKVKIQEQQYLKIKNKDNCCYMIVILQLFYSIRQSIQITDSKDEVVDIFKKILDKKENRIHLLAQEVYQKTKRFKQWSQNDAHQFYLFIVQLISGQHVNLEPISLFQENVYSCSKCNQENVNQNHVYSVPMGMNCYAQNLFNLEGKVEEYVCPHCKQTSTSISKTKYIFFPETKYILVHLLRFYQNGQKNKKPKNLPRQIVHEDSTLKLKLIVCHIGSAKQGHYYTYDNQLGVKVDCNSVSLCALPLDEPYMFLYERIPKNK